MGSPQPKGNSSLCCPLDHHECQVCHCYTTVSACLRVHVFIMCAHDVFVYALYCTVEFWLVTFSIAVLYLILGNGGGVCFKCGTV